MSSFPDADFTAALALMFGGLPQLGPGGDEHTRQALRRLPHGEFREVLDVGCGVGRQTLVLARELDATIHAVDLHQPFLQTLLDSAAKAGLGSPIVTHCLDMSAIADHFSHIDLLWSEGAAYHLGFAEALAAWAPALTPRGWIVLSECCWLTPTPPEDARAFWEAAYPTMGTVEQNLAKARQAGFSPHSTFTLPRSAWTEGYYDHLRPRAAALAEHPQPAVRDLAQEVERELRLFDSAGDSYGYVFFLLERAAR